MRRGLNAVAGWLSWCMLIAQAFASYNIICSPRDTPKVQDAIHEAQNMARNAITRLTSGFNDEVTQGAFNPLFRPHDLPTILGLYAKVRDLDTDPMMITFFCDRADFMLWDDALNSWIDRRFFYVVDGVEKPIRRYNLRSTDQNKRPGDRSSFTVNGYRIPLPVGDADCTLQSHIYVSQTRINPGNDDLDHRSLDVINRDGFRVGMSSLDQLKPLSETIFHELMHALGGLVQPDYGKKVITDDPIAEAGDGKVRMWNKCVQLNQRRTAAMELRGHIPTRRADPLMFLAQALYTQPRGRDTFWSTGTVDVKTHEPLGLPAPKDTANAKRSDNSTFRHRRQTARLWHA